MKKIGIIFLFVLFIGCTANQKHEGQKTSGEDFLPELLSLEDAVSSSDLSVLYNPDMGFYSAETISIQANGAATASFGKVTLLDEEGNFDKHAKFNLIHLKVDISEFKDKDHIMLYENNEIGTGLHSLMDRLYDNGQTAIVRFSYDKGYKGNKKNVEPDDFSKVLSHVTDICEFIKNTTKMITAVECGMLGPWGEMHTTPFAENSLSIDKFNAYLNTISPGKQAHIPSGETEVKQGYIVLLMEKFLTELESCDVPFLVRQPMFIYNYLKYMEGIDFNGKDVPENYQPVPGSKLYKLGLYNDGYLSSKSDEGTFRIHSGDNRNDEIAFLDAFTNHTPYGGELIGCYSLSNSDEQLRNVHLSFLNIGWNANVLSALDGKTTDYCNGDSIFKYMLKHMGYRYVVKHKDDNVVFKDGIIKVNLELENIGFADMPYHREKEIVFGIFDEGQEYFMEPIETRILDRKFKGSDRKIQFELDVKNYIGNGKYIVYLRLCDEEERAYPIRLDGDVEWLQLYRANKIANLEVTGVNY